jgi:hypothetical protein
MSWRSLYVFVLGTFAVLVIVFTLLTRIYR